MVVTKNKLTKNKLTKNFNYLEQDCFNSNHKDKIIDAILVVEKFKNLDDCIVKMSHALECLLLHFIEKEDLTKTTNDLELKNLIDIINNSGIINSRFIISNMHFIRKKRNHVVYKNRDIDYNYEIYEVVAQLKTLFTIIKTLFPEIVPEDLEFDTKCYSGYIGDTSNNNISAISEKQRHDDNKDFSNIKENLEVDKDSIISWLSIKDSKLVIPIYQRKYEWKEENIDALFEDIKYRMEDGDDHYFGTIAQKKTISKNLSELPHQIKIIDGQQRITSSFLLIVATRQILLEKFNKKIEEIDWYQKIIQNHHVKIRKLSDYIHNPGGTDDNNEAFEHILDNDSIQIDKNHKIDKQTNFYKNYKRIYDRLLNEFNDAIKITEFINTFLYKFKVATINFDNNVFSQKSEMEIFENLNSKGVELTIPDLIKNHIFNFCSDQLLRKSSNDIAKTYNKALGSIGMMDDKKIEEFYQVLSEVIKGSELNKNRRIRFNSVKESINEFFKKREEIDTKYGYEEIIIRPLQDYMRLYKEAIDQRGKFIQFVDCEKLLKIISNHKKKDLFSYFIFILFKFIQIKHDNQFNFLNHTQSFKLSSRDKESIRNLILVLVQFIIRTQIITGQGDSNIRRTLIGIAHKYWNLDSYKNKSIDELCKDIVETINNRTNELYPHSEFELKIKSINSSKGIFDLLVLTEYTMNNALDGKGECIERSKPTIEHIMPKEYSNWCKDLDESDKQSFENKAKEYIEKLGNYLILTNSKNSKACNSIFLDKKQKVYKDLISPLYKNSNFEIDVSEKKEWTFESIDKRTNALVDYICKHVISK